MNYVADNRQTGIRMENNYRILDQGLELRITALVSPCSYLFVVVLGCWF